MTDTIRPRRPAQPRPRRTIGIPPSELTDRERQVLVLVAQGLTSAQTGAALFVTTDTVKSHLSRIYLKLGVHNRAAAVAKALHTGQIA